MRDSKETSTGWNQPRKKITVDGTGFFRGPTFDKTAIWAAFCGQGTPARRLGLGDETRIG